MTAPIGYDEEGNEIWPRLWIRRQVDGQEHIFGIEVRDQTVILHFGCERPVSGSAVVFTATEALELRGLIGSMYGRERT